MKTNTHNLLKANRKSKIYTIFLGLILLVHILMTAGGITYPFLYNLSFLTIFIWYGLNIATALKFSNRRSLISIITITALLIYFTIRPNLEAKISQSNETFMRVICGAIATIAFAVYLYIRRNQYDIIRAMKEIFYALLYKRTKSESNIDTTKAQQVIIESSPNSNSKPTVTDQINTNTITTHKVDANPTDIPNTNKQLDDLNAWIRRQNFSKVPPEILKKAAKDKAFLQGIIALQKLNLDQDDFLDAIEDLQKLYNRSNIKPVD